MKQLTLGFLALLAAHPATAPPSTASHDSIAYAQPTIGSTAVAPLLNEQATCYEVAIDDTHYCALAVIDSVELASMPTGNADEAAIGLDLDRMVSKTLSMMNRYHTTSSADARATFEDSSCAGTVCMA